MQAFKDALQKAFIKKGIVRIIVTSQRASRIDMSS